MVMTPVSKCTQYLDLRHWESTFSSASSKYNDLFAAQTKITLRLLKSSATPVQVRGANISLFFYKIWSFLILFCSYHFYFDIHWFLCFYVLLSANVNPLVKQQINIIIIIIIAQWCLFWWFWSYQCWCDARTMHFM